MPEPQLRGCPVSSKAISEFSFSPSGTVPAQRPPSLPQEVHKHAWKATALPKAAPWAAAASWVLSLQGHPASQTSQVPHCTQRVRSPVWIRMGHWLLNTFLHVGRQH